MASTYANHLEPNLAQCADKLSAAESWEARHELHRDPLYSDELIGRGEIPFHLQAQRDRFPHAFHELIQ